MVEASSVTRRSRKRRSAPSSVRSLARRYASRASSVRPRRRKSSALVKQAGLGALDGDGDCAVQLHHRRAGQAPELSIQCDVRWWLAEDKQALGSPSLPSSHFRPPGSGRRDGQVKGQRHTVWPRLAASESHLRPVPGTLAHGANQPEDFIRPRFLPWALVVSNHRPPPCKGRPRVPLTCASARIIHADLLFCHATLRGVSRRISTCGVISAESPQGEGRP